MAENLIDQFHEAFWELRLRRLSGWERIVAEEILLRTWGRNRPHLHIRRLEYLAGFWGLSRGNIHAHLEQLLRFGIVENDARAAMAARLGKDWQKSSAARPDKDAQFWWVNDIKLWDVRRRVDPDSPAGARSAECDAALRDDNPESPGQMHLTGFEERTGGEVQADAALARAESLPTAGPTTAASSPASRLLRSTFWNQTVSGSQDFVPESGTGVPETGTTVPESGTKAERVQEDAPVYARARPGSQDQNSQASQAARGEQWEPGAAERNGPRQWRTLTAAEEALRDEIEAWCLEGGDDPTETAEKRPALERRIRAFGMGINERAFRDLQLGVKEGRDVVKKARGGLLKCRFEEFLRRQPPKMHGPLKAASRPAPRPGVAVAPPLSEEEDARIRAEHLRRIAEMKQRVGGGAN